MQSSSPWQGSSDRALLRAALKGDNSAAVAANERLLPDSKLNPFCRGLPSDRRDEVRSHVWLLLVTKQRAALDTVLPIPTMLNGLVRDAVKAVRAQYRDPGSRSRRRRGEDARRTVSLEALPDAFHPSSGGEDEMFRILELNAVLDAAAGPVKRALTLVHLEGHDIESAATAVGMTRRTLLRRIMALRSAA